jgi:hypothetical protein
MNKTKKKPAGRPMPIISWKTDYLQISLNTAHRSFTMKLSDDAKSVEARLPFKEARHVVHYFSRMLEQYDPHGEREIG